MKSVDHIGVKRQPIYRYRSGKISQLEDEVIIEQPVEIRIKYQQRITQLAITMRTPGSDEALAIGFLFTEGIIQSLEQVESVKQVDDNVVLVNLTNDIQAHLDDAKRHTFMSSSCGICGKASLDLIKTNSQYLPWTAKFNLKTQILTSLRRQMDGSQNMFSMTGGNHAVSLYSLDGRMIVIAEDVGRHNAMDKLVGEQLMVNGLPLDKHICLLSGRASFELVQKAMMAGIACLVSVGAPSSLAIDLAEECGMTLIGFMKDDSFNIYAGFERVEF